ncbi:MAG: hypothetical protein ACYCYP_01140 [Leptospirales bacterium]
MENEKQAEAGEKKRWTLEKARIVRQYPKDPVGLADPANETVSFPRIDSIAGHTGVEGLERTFSRKTTGERHLRLRRSSKDCDVSQAKISFLSRNPWRSAGTPGTAVAKAKWTPTGHSFSAGSGAIMSSGENPHLGDKPRSP